MKKHSHSGTKLDQTNLEALLRQQESLRQVIESISSQLEPRPLLARIIHHACELLGADKGTIGLVDEKRNLIRIEATYRMPAGELGAEMPPGVGLAGQVLLTQQPVILDRYGDLAQPVLVSESENSVIGLPIFWRNRLIGFFGIGVEPPRRFTKQDVEILTIFARHAAIAIENARLFSQSQTALDETRLLYETSQRISMALDVDEVIAAYLQQVATRGHYACHVGLYEFNEAGERTSVIVRGRWTLVEGLCCPLHERVPYTRDALDPPLDAGQTITISNVHTDPRTSAELRQIQSRDRRPALAMIPLIVNGQRIGLIILSYPSVHQWQAADLHPYQVTAAQLAVAIHNRHQQHLLYQRGRQVAVLEERQRLARELHDSVTQLIFSITLIAQSIVPAWRRDPGEGEHRVNRLLELSQMALAEMRTLLADLRLPDLTPASPSAAAEQETNRARAKLFSLTRLQQEGLVVALNWYIATVVRDRLQIELDAAGYLSQPFAQEEALYRIAQEALNNVIKHASARQVKIKLSTDEQATYLTVMDDGLGFVHQPTSSPLAQSFGPVSTNPVNHNEGGNKLGLISMHERVETLGGSIYLTSTPGDGTTVTVMIPRKD